MRPLGLFFPAFLLSMLILGAQSGDEPRIISPYVTDLTAELQEGKVFLSWTDSRDLDNAVYLVYRSDKEISKENLPQAVLVSTISQGVEKFSDSPEVLGRYFYAVLAKDSSGKVWQFFLPHRNKTVSAQEFTPAPPPEPKAPDPKPPAQELPPPEQPPVTVPPPAEKPVPAVQATPAPSPVPGPVTAPRGLAVPDSRKEATGSPTGIRVEPARPLALPGRRLGIPDSSPAAPLDPETAQALSSLLKAQGRGTTALPSMKIFPEEASSSPGTGFQKELHTLVRSHFLQGKWSEGAPLFTSLAAKDGDRNRQARAYYYAGQSYLKAGDPRSALVNFLQARRTLPEAQSWVDILLTPGVQNLPLKDLLPLEVEGATEEMLRPLAAATRSTVKILEETALFGAGAFKKPVVSESQKNQWVAQAEALADTALVAAFEKTVEKADAEGVLDQLVAALELDTARREAPPGLHFALSLAYGRQGLIQKAYQAVVTAVQKASAPGIVFNLAMAYGRRDLLAGSGNAGVATLAVTSTPPGSTVRLNGQEVGQSPMTLDGLRPGNHQIEVYRLLYTPKTLTVSLSPGDKKDLDVGLGPLKNELTPQEEFSGKSVPEVRVQLGHSGEISAMAFTPDSKNLITGSTDGGIRIWSTAGRIEIQNLPGHFGKITDLDLSPDGKVLGSASWDGTVKLWDMETGALLFSLEGHSNMVNSLDFSADGQRLVTGSWDTTMRVWSVSTGQLLTSSPPQGTGLSDTVWTGQESISALDQNGTLILWDITAPDRVKSLPGALGSGDGRLYWDQDGKRLLGIPVTGGNPAIFDPAEMTTLGPLEGTYGSFVAEPSTPRLGRILSLRKDGHGKTNADLRLLAKSGTILRELSLSASLDRGVLSPDGAYLACTSGRNLHWFHADTGESLTRNFPIPGLSDISVLSPQGNITAVRTQDTALTLVDAVTGIPAGIYETKSTISALAFSADGTVLVIGSITGQVFLLDLQKKLMSPPLSLGSGDVKQILPLGSGGQVLVLLSDGTVYRVDAKSGGLQRSFLTVPQARRMAVDRNGLWLTVQNTGNDLYLYDLSTERQTLVLPKHHSFINDFLFTSDGKELILGDNRGNLALLSLDSGEKAKGFVNLKSPVEKLAIQGNTLAAGALDSTITLWNLAEGKKIRTLYGHLDGITSLSFDKSGKLYSSGKDRLSIMWNGTTGTHLFFQVLNHSDGSYLTWIREGYYTGKGGLEERVVNVVDRSLVVPLSELAFSYKRDDVVAARIQERDILPLLRGR